MILVEQPKGGFKISLRSRCEVDCSQIAERFGGGGHKKAAGAFLNEPLDAARAKVLDAVRAAMKTRVAAAGHRRLAMDGKSTHRCRIEARKR